MRRAKLIVHRIGGAMLVAVWIGLLVDHAFAVAQGPSTPGGPPFDLSDPGVIGEGARLFRQSCTGYCHGHEGGPARAPRLRGQKFEQSYVYGRIMKGSPNGMPAFEATLSQDKIWQLVAYVLSLSEAGTK
jgi:mono/diheme cytochrome c family protein